MSTFEIVAAVLGLVCVGLTIRQNIWCWPTGAVMVALYVYIFWQARLYADAGLQVIIFVLQLYGWYSWLHGRQGNEEMPVRRSSGLLLLALVLLGATASAGLGAGLIRWTDQDLPYYDSAITVFSLIAQLLMARKLLESWLFWIGVDVLAVGVYGYKMLYPTAVLYVVFLVLAAAGYRSWRQSLQPHLLAEKA